MGISINISSCNKRKIKYGFRKYFEKINIIPGDKILVHSNILNVLIKFKKKNKKFDADLIIDSLIKKVGPNGTIMFADL